MVYGKNREILSSGEYPTREAAMKAGEAVRRFGIREGICPDCGEWHAGFPASRIVGVSIFSPLFGLDAA
jgi:hypothetical protein